jgi:hypothetical protein
VGSGLAEFGLEATQPSQEDWGWLWTGSTTARHISSALAAMPRANPWAIGGELCLAIDKHRLLRKKLRGQSPMSESEDIMGILRPIVDGEPDIRFLCIG